MVCSNPGPCVKSVGVVVTAADVCPQGRPRACQRTFSSVEAFYSVRAHYNRREVSWRWTLLHALDAIRLLTLFIFHSHSLPSYTHRVSVDTGAAHKVTLSENVFRQTILYGEGCIIPSRHQKGAGKSEHLRHL